MNTTICNGCGFNATTTAPAHCPLCGTPGNRFLSEQKAAQRSNIKVSNINHRITRLKAEGLGTSAYRLETSAGSVWIDCLPVFNEAVAPVDAILFTHRDFMGATDRYQQAWHAETWLHRVEQSHPLAQDHHITHGFDDNFCRGDLEAFVIGGHTPGFTVYLHKDALFVCDLVLGQDDLMRFNAAGSPEANLDAATRLNALLRRRKIRVVCGYNSVTDFRSWQNAFKKLLARTERSLHALQLSQPVDPFRQTA